jgi:type III pantothenate kinase
MNLVFDFGNTRIKGAIFKEDSLLRSFFIDNHDFNKIKKINELVDISKIGITSVVNIPLGFKSQIEQLNIPILIIDNATPLPIKIKYDTPETLGADRICNAVAGYSAYPNKNVLIVDFGTCNKYDFVDQKGSYLGGSISPGYKMRLDAMHYFTDNLPEIDPSQMIDFIGKSTKSSMQTGAFWGVIGELNEFIRQYQSRFNDINILATGGNLIFFEKVLKNFIFADSNLTLKGINSILNYQRD